MIVEMSEERDIRTEGQPDKPRPWRPIVRKVLWAIALLVALVITALLSANLYSGISKDLAEERVATLLGIGVGLTAIIVLLVIGGRSLHWTGFGGKTLWEWQGVLLVPVTIALIASLFTLYQGYRQQQLENQRADKAQQLETLSAQREMLQSYLGYMGTLLLEKNLRKAGEKRDVRLLARARTLTVLDGVRGDREARVLEFLVETKLIQSTAQGKPPVISLRFANLTEATLGNRFLLSNTDLDRAELTKATLTNAQLINTNLLLCHSSVDG